MTGFFANIRIRQTIVYGNLVDRRLRLICVTLDKKFKESVHIRLHVNNRTLSCNLNTYSHNKEVYDS
jgi:hypothetical protein